MNEDNRQHRADLLKLREQAEAAYDRTLMALSGGALGISFTFVKQFVGDGPLLHTWYLWLAWMGWGMSLACVLVSHYTSGLALTRALIKLGKPLGDRTQLGEPFDTATRSLNAMGGVLFIAGLFSFITFAYRTVR